jgi:antitoxin (DNA-binding transcriptional repressor) of toxin-antitoxin stability system
MKRLSISVTEAARNFADCVNRARYQDVTFVLLKNGAPVAQLTPSSEKVCLGRDLAAALAKVRLTDRDSRSWRRDLHASRETLKHPDNKWK